MVYKYFSEPDFDLITGNLVLLCVNIHKIEKVLMMKVVLWGNCGQ